MLMMPILPFKWKATIHTPCSVQCINNRQWDKNHNQISVKSDTHEFIQLCKFYFRSLFKFEKVQMGLKLQNKTKNKKKTVALINCIFHFGKISKFKSDITPRKKCASTHHVLHNYKVSPNSFEQFQRICADNITQDWLTDGLVRNILPSATCFFFFMPATSNCFSTETRQWNMFAILFVQSFFQHLRYREIQPKQHTMLAINWNIWSFPIYCFTCLKGTEVYIIRTFFRYFLLCLVNFPPNIIREG